MFRYRMSSKPGRTGWIVVLIIAAILFLILAGQLLSRPAADSPSASKEASGVLPRLWADIRDGAVALWQGITAGSPAEQVEIKLDSPAGQGAGDDEEEAGADGISVEVLNPQEPESYVPAGTSPQVFIYHTHTHESYAKQSGQDYVEVAKWRTTDNKYNVVRVGEELARQLSFFHGIAVLHDVTDHEYPKLGTSYSRSLKTLQKNMAENKDLKLLIDLHRDAYDAGIDPASVTINGKKVARIMVVIGTGSGQTGVGFTDRPDYQKNMLLAEAITDRLNEFDPKLARKISLKSGRYNQHVSPGAILIEVGHNENTLDEAMAAIPFLAQAIADAYDTMTENGGAMPAALSSPASASPSGTPAPQAGPTAGALEPVDMPAAPAETAVQQVIVLEPPAPSASAKPAVG